MKDKWEADIVIIGGGVTGVAIARELSRYKLGTILAEKAGELGAGQTKAAMNIYTGINLIQSLIVKSVLLAPGTTMKDLYGAYTLRTRWINEGFKEWGPVLRQLDVRHKYTSILIAAKDEDQIERLNSIRDLGRDIGGIYANFREMSREEILDTEPYVNKNVVKGLFADGVILDIFNTDLVFALAENAVQNGAKIMLNTEVTGISHNGRYQIVRTTKGNIKTKFIVNAAGGWCHKVADMGGARDWGLQYRKNNLIILDKSKGYLVKGSMIKFPGPPGSVYVLQRKPEGNIVLNFGIYGVTNRPDDVSTSQQELLRGLAWAKEIIPSISEKDVINSFGAVRVFNTRNVEDHIVEFASNNPRFLNVVIRLPGLAGVLPMSRHVVGMLADAGLELVTKSDFNPYRKEIPRFHDLSDDERREPIKKDPKYGHVVCRCETVTEGEVVEAIKRGARTAEGVRMRTRAGMGRCKGGFCGPRVIQILARELGIAVTKVSLRSENSQFLLFKSKELLEEKKEALV